MFHQHLLKQMKVLQLQLHSQYLQRAQDRHQLVIMYRCSFSFYNSKSFNSSLMQLQQQFQTFQQAMSSGMPQQQQQQQQQQMMGLMQQMQSHGTAALCWLSSCSHDVWTAATDDRSFNTTCSHGSASHGTSYNWSDTLHDGRTSTAANSTTSHCCTGPVPSSATLSQPFGATVGTTPAQPLAQQNSNQQPQ